MSDFPNSSAEFLAGQVFLVNKPVGWSSFDVVKKIKNLIRNKYKIKKIKVGHAGTLDPLATGLLIICTGKLTKQIHKIQEQKKTYTGSITLGSTTPSYDLESKIDGNYETKHITEQLIKDTLLKFIGNIKQRPPVFSALKKDGERLYLKARRGEEVEIKSREVIVHSFNITSVEMPKLYFEITCGKGTYIRSIAHDFGMALKSGGHLSKLCRTKIGRYHLKNAINIDFFEKKLNK
tara:strand:- start:749 stop:1453 length:705 start_codon:yes stop_codon:yes gene_type:complete